MNGAERIKTGTRILLAAALVFGAVGVVRANPVYQTANGTRPMGMGETFTAIANDGNAVAWNPAGLPGLQRHELTSMYSNLYGLGFSNGYLAYTFPVMDNHSVGFDWAHSGFDDSELMYRRDKISLAYGYRLTSYLSLGVNAKYLNTELGLDSRSLGTASGFGLDFGLLARPTDWLGIGLTAHDLSGTSVKHDTDISEQILSQRFRAGVAVYPFDGLTLAADVDDRIHLGAEYWLMGLVALRAGLQRDIETYGRPLGNTLHYSAGLSFRYRFLRFDYAYVNNPILPPTQYFSVSFLSSPSFVSIKNTEIKHSPIFRSLYRSYEDSPFLNLTIKNAAQEEVQATVKLEIPTLLDTAYEERIVLTPQSTKQYSINVSFPEDVLESDRAAFDHLVQPTVSITYQQNRQERETSSPTQNVYILGRNKISWTDPTRAASFVTSNDPAVDTFARQILLDYEDVLTTNFNNSNIGKAALLFDNLGALGTQYNPDQTTPFVQVAGETSAFDTIKFPGEMLHARVGDCDDLTVVYASLLTNLGIRVAMLDVDAPGEGHIYLMFDSGIAPEDAGKNFIDQNEFAEWNGAIWIPVEVTLIGRSFFDAWRNGASEYHRRKAEGYIHEFDVTEAQSVYRPGQVSSDVIEMPSREQVDLLLVQDLSAFDSRFEDMTLSAGIDLTTPEGLYEAGALALRYNRNTQAEDYLNKALALKPDIPDALNGLGVIATRNGDFEGALEFYNRALQLTPDDAGLHINIAITNYLMGRRVEAQQSYQRAVQLDPSLDGELLFLE
ncbi:tetratricopeptide repeat protein [candidate division KSB1 bacterium]